MNGTEPSGRQSPEFENNAHNHLNGNAIDGPDDDVDMAANTMHNGSFGRATTGKSGRVIERLMAECDRLRRDLNVQTSARDEERKSKEALRSSRDSLQSTNDILVHQTNIDKRSLEKRARKIDELRAEITNEKALRLQAETNLRQVLSQNDSELQNLKAEVVNEGNLRTKAIAQYDALAAGWRNLDEGYRVKMEKLNKRLDVLVEGRTKDQALLQRLEITIEQQRQELDKMRMAKQKIAQKFEDCMGLAEKGIRDIQEKMQRTEEEADTILANAQKTLDELRYTLNIKKNVKSLYGDDVATDQ